MIKYDPHSYYYAQKAGMFFEDNHLKPKRYDLSEIEINNSIIDMGLLFRDESTPNSFSLALGNYNITFDDLFEIEGVVNGSVDIPIFNNSIDVSLFMSVDDLQRFYENKFCLRDATIEYFIYPFDDEDSSYKLNRQVAL